MINFQDWANRSALLQSWKGRCAYCTNPLTLTSMQADHVIPEEMPEKVSLAEMLRLYGISEDYDIQGWQNRAPACATCNRTKSNYLIMNRAPILLWFLRKVRENAKRAETAATSTRSRGNRDKTIARTLKDLGIPPDKHATLALMLTQAAEAADAVSASAPESELLRLRITNDSGLEKRGGGWAAYGSAETFLRISEGRLGVESIAWGSAGHGMTTERAAELAETMVPGVERGVCRVEA